MLGRRVICPKKTSKPAYYIVDCRIYKDLFISQKRKNTNQICETCTVHRWYGNFFHHHEHSTYIRTVSS